MPQPPTKLPYSLHTSPEMTSTNKQVIQKHVPIHQLYDRQDGLRFLLVDVGAGDSHCHLCSNLATSNGCEQLADGQAHFGLLWGTS